MKYLKNNLDAAAVTFLFIIFMIALIISTINKNECEAEKVCATGYVPMVIGNDCRCVEE